MMFLICISLMADDIDYLFMCLFVILILSSMVKCLFKSFTHFLIVLFVFLLLSLRVLCIFWIHGLRWMCRFQIYSFSLCPVFSFSWQYLWKNKRLLNLTKSNLSIFFLFFYASCMCHSKNSFPNSRWQGFILCFF